MSAQAHYFRIGLFVISGVILALAGVIGFGAGKFFRDKFMAETYLDESVQGLEVGSPVKYRGVQIGSVSAIMFVGLEYLGNRAEEPAQLRRLVIVRMNLDQVPRLAARRVTSQEVASAIQDSVSDGLRVRLASQGITGVGYIEADYFDPQQFPPMRITWEPKYAYIPSAPSTMTRFTQSVEEVLQKLQRTEIDGLVADARSMVQQVDGAFKEADLKSLAADIRGLVQHLDRALVQARLPEAVADIRRLARSLEAALQDADLKGLSAEAHQLLQRLDGAVQDADLKGLSAEARWVLGRLDGAVRDADLGGLHAEARQLLRRLEGAVQDADIPGLRRELGALLAGAQDALRQLDAAAIRQEAVALLGELRQTNRDIQELVARVQVEPILAEIHSALAKVNGIVGRLDAQLSGREIEQTLRNMADASAEIVSASKELGGTIQLLRRKLSRVDAAAITDEIEAILDSLRRVSESLEGVTRNAERYPSQVLFGEPPPRASVGGTR